MFNDQHPVFKAPYSREKVHVIMRLIAATRQQVLTAPIQAITIRKLPDDPMEKRTPRESS